MVRNKIKGLMFGAILTFAFTSFSSIANSDEITFSRNVVERFSHKDWVAYRTDSGHCRPTTEFLIGGTVASLAILRSNSSNRNAHAWAHVYGEYINSLVELNLDGQPMRWRSLEQETIEKLADSQVLSLTAKIYTELPPQSLTQEIVQVPTIEKESKVSLAGSSAALRFCNFID
ncbi:hypothetical protein [Marinobacter salarius]